MTGILTGIMTGIMTCVTGDVKLVFIAVELDCYAYSWCIHTPSSDIQQGWYAGINIPLHWVLPSHFINLFINLVIRSLCQTEQFRLYQFVIDFLFIPVSHILLCLYQSYRL